MGVKRWDDEMDVELKKLYGGGYSCSQIASKMGRNLTRNAIIGRSHRLGLCKPLVIRAKVHRPPPRVRPPAPRVVVNAGSHRNRFRTSQAVAGEISPIRRANVVPRNVALVDLKPDDCRYPYGDGPFVFCGHAKDAGSSYCSSHHQLVVYHLGGRLPQAEQNQCMEKAA